MFKKILMGLGILFLVFIVIGIASGGGEEDNNVTATVEETETNEPATQEEEEAEEPAAEEKQDKNTVGNWQIMNKPKFKNSFGRFDTVDLKVMNVSDSEDEPWLEIRLTKGNNLVTTFDCIGQTVDAGQTTTLECTSFDKYRPFTDYEIQNAF